MHARPRAITFRPPAVRPRKNSIVGASPSGKAVGSDPTIRRFESSRPSQPIFLALVRHSENRPTPFLKTAWPVASPGWPRAGPPLRSASNVHDHRHAAAAGMVGKDRDPAVAALKRNIDAPAAQRQALDGDSPGARRKPQKSSGKRMPNCTAARTLQRTAGRPIDRKQQRQGFAQELRFAIVTDFADILDGAAEEPGWTRFI